VITLLLISTFVVILNETIMSVALPRLMEDLHITASTAQWLTTAFLLTMAIVIPITGFLLQRLNTRTVYVTAMTLFSVGTLIAAIAPGFPLLIVARVIQASGTAIMIPLLFTTVLTLVPEQSRGRIMGNISIVISVAPAIGPTVSGLILSVLDWRWMFIIVLPIAVTTLIIGARRVPNVTEPRKTPLDVLSVILAAFGFGGVVYGLSNLATAAPMVSAISLGVGGVALAAFIARQLVLQRRDIALLDLRTFKSSNFTFAIIMIVVSMIALFGTLILIPMYTVGVLGLDELSTGLLLLPGGLIMGFFAPFVGRAFDRIGPKPLLVTGSIIVSAVLWSMTMLSATTSFWWLLAAHIALSVGLALLFTPLFTAGLGGIPPHLYSHGSAIVSTIQQLAGAAGIAVFITVMTARTIAAAASGSDAVEAAASGIHSAFVVGAIVSLVAIPIAFFVRKPASSMEGAPAGH
jgi:DHA2 family lincomycin resistance protein-like MFS transporter